MQADIQSKSSEIGVARSRSDWETISDIDTSAGSTSSVNSNSLAANTTVKTHSKDQRQTSSNLRPFPPALQAYWKERAKFIKHLEKRSDKFAKRSKEDYDLARWGTPKKKNNTKAAIKSKKTAPVSPSKSDINTEASVPPTPVPETPSTPLSDSSSNDMIASTSAKGALRAASVR
jgi:hypothetical protein